jgi:molybdopterin-guanine dinucleotide biosynthesis protein B
MTKRRSRRKPRQTTSSLDCLPPILAVVGRSGSGKTTLVESLLHELIQKRYSVGTIKNAKGGFQLDLEGKDSAKHYRAGAQGVALVSEEQGEAAFLTRLPAKLSIEDLCKRLFPDVDLVILEGFKELPFPKIEVTRGESLCCDGDPNLVAVVGHDPDSRNDAPCFTLRDIPALVRLIEDTLGLTG